MTCPDGFEKNTYDECILFVNEAKTYADASAHCTGLGSKVSLMMLLLPVRFIDFYGDLKNGRYFLIAMSTNVYCLLGKFTGFTMNDNFWMGATKDANTGKFYFDTPQNERVAVIATDNYFYWNDLTQVSYSNNQYNHLQSRCLTLRYPTMETACFPRQWQMRTTNSPLRVRIVPRRTSFSA